MLAAWTRMIVSTWSHDGHLRAPRHNKAAVPIPGREATDCAGSLDRGSIGSTGGPGARTQRQPAIQLVSTVSGGATGPAGAGQTDAGASQRGELPSIAGIVA